MGLAKGKSKLISFRLLGGALLALSVIAVLFSLYILIFGVKAQARFSKVQPVNKGTKYINTYEYSADGETYKYTERVSNDAVAVKGDTVTVRYLSFLPGITFSSTLLWLGVLTAAIGALCFKLGRQKE